MCRDQQRDDPDSTLSLYRAALRARPRLGAPGVVPSLEWVEIAPEVLAFEREGGARCVTNLGRAPIELDDVGRLLLASDALDEDGRLPPDTSVWF